MFEKGTNQQRKFSWQKGFTLAEVIITIGIIGIIAAMTMPILMTKYRKRTVEAKLPKFYSTMKQALELSKNENGSIFLDVSDVTSHQNQEKISEWYNKYLIPYLNGATLEPGKGFHSHAVKVYLPDGSGFWSYLQNASENSKVLWMNYCVNISHRTCSGFETYDGRNGFLFYYDSNNETILPEAFNNTLTQAKNSCYVNYAGEYRKHACSAVIYKNQWKIPEDYPWIK